MPYLRESQRKYAAEYGATSPGSLNYLISRMAFDYFQEHTQRNYDAMNAVIGAIECAKQEFYRRVVVPYENDKCLDNGDVFV